MRNTAKKFRRKKILAGEFPVRDHAGERSPEKADAIERRIKAHLRRKGVHRLKDGTYVLLGIYPDDVANYILEHREFPPGIQV
jgi:hypothetical protein